MRRATVILDEAGAGLAGRAEGDMFVFSPQVAAVMRAGYSSPGAPKALYLYDIDPSLVVWCREEVIARKEAIKAGVGRELWFRAAAMSFDEPLFTGYCTRLMTDRYYEFVRHAVKLRHLLGMYDEVVCIAGEGHCIHDRSLASHLPGGLSEFWSRTVRVIANPVTLRDRLRGAKTLFRQLGELLRLSGNNREVAGGTQKYAVRLETGVRSGALSAGLDAGSFRDPAFVVDGGSFSPEDVFFYHSWPCPEEAAAIKTKGLEYVDADRLSAGLPALKRARVLLSHAFASMLLWFAPRRTLKEMVYKGFVEYLRAKALCLGTSCRAHISALDSDPMHIMRTAGFRSSGVATAQLPDSMAHFMMRGVANPTWLEMSYDVFFTPGRVDTEEFRRHTDNVVEFREVGIVRVARKRELLRPAEELRRGLTEASGGAGTVVAVFDENAMWRDTEVNYPNWEEIWKLIEDVLVRLPKDTGCHVIYKPKLADEGTFYAARETQEKTGLPFLDIRSGHGPYGTVSVLDYRTDSVYATLAADVVISPAFSTTGFEAVTLGKPVIFYDPGGSYRDHPLSRVEGLVASDYEQLKELLARRVSDGVSGLAELREKLSDYVYTEAAPLSAIRRGLDSFLRHNGR